MHAVAKNRILLIKYAKVAAAIVNLTTIRSRDRQRIKFQSRFYQLGSGN